MGKELPEAKDYFERISIQPNQDTEDPGRNGKANQGILTSGKRGLGWVFLHDGKPEEAHKLFMACLELDLEAKASSDETDDRQGLAACKVKKRDFGGAIVDLLDCHSRFAKLGDVVGQWETQIWQAQALAGLGSPEEARQLLITLEEQTKERGYKLFERLAREELQDLLGDAIET